MAGHYSDRSQGSRWNADERQDAHSNGQRRDQDWPRDDDRQRGNSFDRDAETQRRMQHEAPWPRYGEDPTGRQSRVEGQGDRERPDERRPIHRGSGNYARDWLGARSSPGAPDDARGGGFGGPQDSDTRQGHQAGGLDDGRVFGGMPSGVPVDREGDSRRLAYDWAGNQRGGAARYGPDAPRGRTGAFRGIGPKGYQRSDERLKEIICERLSDDDAIDASEVSVAVSHGEVTVEGTVTDRSTKYRIEDLIDACGSVKEIHNRLRVQDRHRAPAGSSSASGYTDKASEGRNESASQLPAGTGKI